MKGDTGGLGEIIQMFVANILGIVEMFLMALFGFLSDLFGSLGGGMAG